MTRPTSPPATGVVGRIAANRQSIRYRMCMQITIVQYDITWEDKQTSQLQMNAMLDDSPPHEHGFVLVPELCDVGFSLNLDAIVDDRTTDWARERAMRDRCWIQYGEARIGPDGRGLNRANVVDPDGVVRGTYDKIHPFSHGRESEHYSGGDSLQLVDIGGLIVCPMICYDLRFPELWRLARMAGAEAFAIGASWPAARSEHWKRLLVARAIENQAFVFACNRCGSDPHLDYAGGSMIVSPTGEILAEGGTGAGLLQIDVDPGESRNWRNEFRCHDDLNEALLGTIDVKKSDPA